MSDSPEASVTLRRSELRSWIKLVGGFKALFEALDRQLRDEVGISHDDYVILSRLQREGGRTVRMSELARDLAYSPSRLSHAFSRLEKEGWVRRTRSKTDRRVVEASLTDAGADMVRQASPGHLAMVRELIFNTLGPDLARETADALDRVRRRSESESL